MYEDFTLAENLYYIAALKGIKKKEAKEEVCQLAAKVGLQDVLHKKIKTYSGGMKQRAMFAQALLGNPQILICLLYTSNKSTLSSWSTSKRRCI